jgi:hypothetical protein
VEFVQHLDLGKRSMVKLKKWTALEIMLCSRYDVLHQTFGLSKYQDQHKKKD